MSDQQGSLFGIRAAGRIKRMPEAFLVIKIVFREHLVHIWLLFDADAVFPREHPLRLRAKLQRSLLQRREHDRRFPVLGR